MIKEKTVNSQNETIQEVQEDVLMAQQTTAAASPKSKKGLIIGITAVAVVIAAIIALLVVLLNNGGVSVSIGSDAEPSAIEAKMLDDGTAYIPLYDGTSIVINEDVKSATFTKDRKHIVVCLKDGTLYVTNKELSEKNVIADNCHSIYSVRDDGILYRDEDGSLYKILFVDYSSVYIGNVVDIYVAQDSTTVLYATDDGKIYTMLSTASEGTKVGTYSDSIHLETISNDGQLSLWVTTQNRVATIVLNDGDDRTDLGDADYLWGNTNATFSKDQKIIVITDIDSEEMWIKAAGSNAVAVKLGARPTYNIYTENGLLADEVSTGVNGFYIAIDALKGVYNLYHISINGDRERVLSKVSHYEISDNKIFYTDEESALYYAPLNGAAIGKETKIASDVDYFEITDNGKFIYYTKEHGFHELYCYKIGNKEPVKIPSDVYDVYVSWPLENITYSTDGATVFFFKDVEDIGSSHSGYQHGTLMKWSYGSESAEKVASDVLTNSISGGLDSEEVNPKSFMYMKYTFTNEDENGFNVFGNWMYFNGEESIRIASDCIATLW